MMRKPGRQAPRQPPGPFALHDATLGYPHEACTHSFCPYAFYIVCLTAQSSEPAHSDESRKPTHPLLLLSLVHPSDRNMYAFFKCCYRISAFARMAVPCRADALERIGRRVAEPMWKKSANFASVTTDLSHEAYCKLMVPFYSRELQYAVTKYMSCFFRPVYAGVEVVGMVEASAELTYKLNQLLQSTGCGQSLQDFASKLDCRDVARFGESVPFGLVIAPSSTLGGRASSYATRT